MAQSSVLLRAAKSPSYFSLLLSSALTMETLLRVVMVPSTLSTLRGNFTSSASTRRTRCTYTSVSFERFSILNVYFPLK
jgi:hypothetical protein